MLKQWVPVGLLMSSAILSGCFENGPGGSEGGGGAGIPSVNTSDPRKPNYRPDYRFRQEDKAMLDAAALEADLPLGMSREGELAKASAAGYIGWLRTRGSCYGLEEVSFFLDDENTDNKSTLKKRTFGGSWTNDDYNYGGIGQPGGVNTEFKFCKEYRTSLPQLKHGYVVLRLSSSCPTGSLPFAHFWDNENTGNTNSNSGNISPSTQWGPGSLGHTRMEFCFVPGNPNVSQYEIPPWANLRGAFAYSGHQFGAGCYHNGMLDEDDEDTSNKNAWSYYGLTAAQINEVKLIMNGTTNTHMEFNWCDPPVGSN